MPTDPTAVTEHSRCPVTHDGAAFTVWGHPEARAVATDPARFSSRVSAHLNLPNGLDGQEHQQWRRLVDSYLADEQVLPLYPVFAETAKEIVADLPRGEQIDALSQIGRPLAVRAQSRWLGWDASFEEELLAWMARKQAAVKAQDRAELAAVAEAFDELIQRILTHSAPESTPQESPSQESPSQESPSQRLKNETVGPDQRPISHAELVAVIRNWTAGDMESIAASIAVVVHQLATGTPGSAEKRAALREDPNAAIDEMLRLDDPFAANRRITTQDVELGGVAIPSGSRILINWRAANRDPRVFADSFNPTAHAADNLVFGIGPHICPGHTLSTLQIRAAALALLDGTDDFALAEAHPANTPRVEGAYPPVVLS